MAAFSPSPLVLTKLRVPAARPRVIPRARLLNHLEADRCVSLVLVCAPAGYGKTTLLTGWAQALLKTGTAVAWYALDSSDDDPAPFGSYLIASLVQVLGPLPELTQIAQLLRASPGMDLQRILPVLVNAVMGSQQPCLLILDDYHLVTHPIIHSALAYLLEHRPENLRLAIGCRAAPPLPLARLRARGQLLEIRSGGLRFTVDETTQFLNDVMRLDLPPEGIAELEERTEGWVAGLQLASLAMQAPPGSQLLQTALGQVEKGQPGVRKDMLPAFSGSHRYLVEYLLEEVINRQPEEVQLFLLLTAILDRLCAPLCDAILSRSAAPGKETPRSADILRRLDQANLFIIALDDEAASGTGAGWYRYHHLFRDFLLTWLKRTQPERIPALHRAACEWLAANHFLREAAGQAFQTRDWEYAAAFVEQHGFTLIIHSEMATLHEWCSAFPEEVLQRHPAINILLCYGPAFRFQRQERGKIEARLQQAEQVIARMEDRQMAGGLMDSAIVVRSFLAMAPDPAADPRPHLALARRMLEDYPEGEAGQFSGLLTLGYAYLALLETETAQAYLEDARDVALRGRLYFGVVESTFHLARLAYSQGQLRRSAEICRQAQADAAALLAHPEQELPALGCLDIALGCVLLEQDQLEEAEQRLLHGLELIGWGMNPYYLLTAYTALFRLREIQGRPAEALTYLSSLEAAWPDIAFCTGGLRAAHALHAAPIDRGAAAAAGDPIAWAHDYITSLGSELPLPGLGPFGAAEAFYIASLACGQVQIATGHPLEARAYMQQQLERARSHGLAGREIELSLLVAQADQAEGDLDAARVCLARALDRGQPEGYLRVFDQGSALTGLLSGMTGSEIYGDYVRRILAAITRQEGPAEVPPSATANTTPCPAPQADQPEWVEPLSQRELEVLRLIAGGATNQAIADRLVITVGTVKSHINHILGKLGAHNRTTAIAQARLRGLLD